MFDLPVEIFQLIIELINLSLAAIQHALNVLLVLLHSFPELRNFMVLVLVKCAHHADASLARLAVEADNLQDTTYSSHTVHS